MQKSQIEQALINFYQKTVPEVPLLDFSKEDLVKGKVLLEEFKELNKRIYQLDWMMESEDIFSDDENSTSHESHPYWIEQEKCDRRKEEILGSSIYVQFHDVCFTAHRRHQTIDEYRTKNDFFKDKNRELVEMNSHYKEMNNDLEKSNDRLREEVSLFKTEQSDLRDRNNSLHYENEALKLRVSELEKKLATVLSLVSSD